MLSIIIVHYNCSTIIKDLLDSFFQFPLSISCEIIIVDNASTIYEKGKLLTLENEYKIRIIWNSENAGFGRANNLGAQNATGDILLFLNPDCLIKDQSIELCFIRFRSSEYVACGVSLLYKDGSAQNSGHHFFTWGLNHLLHIPYYGNFLKRIALQLNAKRPSIDNPGSLQEVDWISGAFLMVKKETFLQLNGFDSDFFLYSEEIELCSRLLTKGKLVIYGDLEIVHLEGIVIGSDSAYEKMAYYNLSNSVGKQVIISNLLLIRKMYGITAYCFHILNYLFSIPFLLFFSVLKSIKLRSITELKLFNRYFLNIGSVLYYFIPILLRKRKLYKVI